MEAAAMQVDAEEISPASALTTVGPSRVTTLRLRFTTVSSGGRLPNCRIHLPFAQQPYHPPLPLPFPGIQTRNLAERRQRARQLYGPRENARDHWAVRGREHRERPLRRDVAAEHPRVHPVHGRPVLPAGLERELPRCGAVRGGARRARVAALAHGVLFRGQLGLFRGGGGRVSAAAARQGE